MHHIGIQIALEMQGRLKVSTMILQMKQIGNLFLCLEYSKNLIVHLDKNLKLLIANKPNTAMKQTLKEYPIKLDKNCIT